MVITQSDCGVKLAEPEQVGADDTDGEIVEVFAGKQQHHRPADVAIALVLRTAPTNVLLERREASICRFSPVASDQVSDDGSVVLSLRRQKGVDDGIDDPEAPGRRDAYDPRPVVTWGGGVGESQNREREGWWVQRAHKVCSEVRNRVGNRR